MKRLDLGDLIIFISGFVWILGVALGFSAYSRFNDESKIVKK